MMDDIATYPDVTPALFECVKTVSEKQHGTIYLPRNASRGIATTDGIGWTVALRFEIEPSLKTITYTIVDKTWFVPKSAIWNGIRETIDDCRQRAPD